MRGKRWKIIAGEKSSRGKLSACLGATGFENKVWSGTQPNTCTATGKNWPGESPCGEELALLRESDSFASGRHTGPKSDEGWWRRERLVGAVEV